GRWPRRIMRHIRSGPPAPPTGNFDDPRFFGVPCRRASHDSRHLSSSSPRMKQDVFRSLDLACSTPRPAMPPAARWPTTSPTTMVMRLRLMHLQRPLWEGPVAPTGHAVHSSGPPAPPSGNFDDPQVSRFPVGDIKFL